MALSAEDARHIVDQSDDWRIDDEIDGNHIAAERTTGMWGVEDDTLVELVEGGWVITDVASHATDEHLRVWLRPAETSIEIQ